MKALVACIACLSLAQAAAAETRVYDSDPSHLWNRLHEALFVRVGPDGARYGEDRLDPLLWNDTAHLLEGESHGKALELLNEFVSKRGERLIRDPLKRAFLQHDLWALFDWSASGWHSRHADEKERLQMHLARVMRRIALRADEIARLPDNYVRAEAASSALFPRGLFQRESEWINIGVSQGGFIAPEHAEHFGGRSVFHVFLRLPTGREATLAYLERLRSFERSWIYAEATKADDYRTTLNPKLPQFPAGTMWALVRRMNVIDADGELRATPFIESIQLRRYVFDPADPAAAGSYEERIGGMQATAFIARRTGEGALREIAEAERDFVQFRSHGIDPFEFIPSIAGVDFSTRARSDVRRLCINCHQAPGIFGVLSFARIADAHRLRAPQFTERDPAEEFNFTVYWKGRQYDYGLLQGLWTDSMRREQAAEKGAR